METTMMMSKEEWESHCIDTGCSMSYDKYVEAGNYIIGKLRNEKTETILEQH